MARIVCFGELLLRMAAPGRELLLQTGRLEVHVGGAEANVAVALSCLGHEASMVSRLPSNALGDAAIRYLRCHGVAVEHVARSRGRMGLYFMSKGAGLRPSSIVYDREGSSFSLASANDYDWHRLLRGADLLHLSGITPALGETSSQAAITAASVARSLGVKVSFDGNYRAMLWQSSGMDPGPILAELVSSCDFFFGNHRDIALLLGRTFEGEGGERRREAATAAFAAFPNLQVIASTARHLDDADRHRLSARIDTREREFQTEDIPVAGIVDRIGGGDAFAAGVLHGLLEGADYETATRVGLALTCLKHSLPGDASLFTQREIDAFLAGQLDVMR